MDLVALATAALMAAQYLAAYSLEGARMSLSALFAYVKREPVRVASLVVATAVVAVSLVTGVPVVVIVAQVAVYAGVFEKVRSLVSPVVKLAPGDHEAQIDEALDMVAETAAQVPVAVDEIKAAVEAAKSAVSTTSVSQGVGKVD